jgi:hypothetical protein
VLHSGRLRPYSQTLDKPRKACKVQPVQLLCPILKLQIKSFMTLTPCIHEFLLILASTCNKFTFVNYFLVRGSKVIVINLVAKIYSPLGLKSVANVIKLFTIVIYSHSMVIPSFCVIKH